MVQSYSSPTAAEVVRAWKRAGARMQELRDREIREADTVVAMQQLSGAFNQAIAQLPLRDTSGLVEQQAWFSKLRAREGVR
ncbi:hypothetical protein EBZ37_08615 [bacterium]|jgi:hypothetical protein|nr:hypothetical protein [bacterium]